MKSFPIRCKQVDFTQNAKIWCRPHLQWIRASDFNIPDTRDRELIFMLEARVELGDRTQDQWTHGQSLDQLYHRLGTAEKYFFNI